MMAKLAGTVKDGKTVKCYHCGQTITSGQNVYKYRERALSYREAMHTGTMYPTRYVCASCAE